MRSVSTEAAAQVRPAEKCAATIKVRERRQLCVEDRGAFPSGIAASEEPVFSPKAYWPDGVFGGVVGDLQAAIGAIAGERLPARARVADGAREIALARN